MIRLFKHYIPHAALFLALVDLCLLLAAVETAWVMRANQIGMEVDHIGNRLGQLLIFALSVQALAVAVGVYGADALRSRRSAMARLLGAFLLGAIFYSALVWLLPGMRSGAVHALGLGFIYLAFSRILLDILVGEERFKRRLLVLGAGKWAQRIKELAAKPGSGFVVVGYVAMNDHEHFIPEAIGREAINNLADIVVKMGASEVVLALEERRNTVPLDDLLRIKTTGIQVNDFSSFIERETGRIDLDSVHPGWLIFSDGFSSGRRFSGMMKRLFDIVASSALLLFAAPIILLCAIMVKLESKGPAFYREVRVGQFGQRYTVFKMRSVQIEVEGEGKAMWAIKHDPRITAIGTFIRKFRIDQLPQTWNVLKGEMSFVGPHPERPEFVADVETQLSFYAQRHTVKPGITGWAQVNYADGASMEASRHRLEYDLYYAKNYTPFLDMLILLQTIRAVLLPKGAR